MHQLLVFLTFTATCTRQNRSYIFEDESRYKRQIRISFSIQRPYINPLTKHCGAVVYMYRIS